MTARGFLGIDGGGSTTSVRLEDDAGTVVLEHSGRGMNPRSLSAALLDRHLDELLQDVPQPLAAAVCLAGMAREDTRDLVGRSIERRFPATVLRLESDAAAALRCFDGPLTACVIAGTGSIVCSRSASGALVTSGGHGYLLGDHGSAFRLGQRLVTTYLEDAPPVSALGPAIHAALGVIDRSEIIAAVHRSPTPAALVARAAPILTQRADDGKAWALAVVANEMDMLAATACTHLHRHHDHVARPVIGLLGGVWASRAARASFERAMQSNGVTLASLSLPDRPPVEAAVLLARDAVA